MADDCVNNKWGYRGYCWPAKSIWVTATTASPGPMEIERFGNGPEYYVSRRIDASCGERHEYLHKDGSWNSKCTPGFYASTPGFYASKREAEVAAVLAGMPSPEVEKLKGELADVVAHKQRLVSANGDLLNQIDKLKAAYAGESECCHDLIRQRDKLKHDLEKFRATPCSEHPGINWGEIERRLDCIDRACDGLPARVPIGDSPTVNKVRKLRADYNALNASTVDKSTYEALGRLFREMRDERDSANLRLAKVTTALAHV